MNPTLDFAPEVPEKAEWFVNSRFGLFLHWGTYSLAARHEWVKSREKMKDEEYQRYFDNFFPDLFQPREWARAAREAGMEYMVVTTKHHEGFCLWDTQQTEYKATRTPWGQDLLTPLVEAFRAEGLRIGFYYSLIDWHHPEFPVDRLHPQAGDDVYRRENAQRDVRKYAAYMRDQVRELLTGFGQIDLLWFDYSYPGEDGKGCAEWESDALMQLIRELQPQALVNNRLDLPHAPDFLTPEQYQPLAPVVDSEERPVIWEGCQTLSGSWGYHRDEASWKSPGQLIGMLVDSVSKNGNLLLNVGPTGRGEFDWRAKERLSQIGDWMHYHNRSIRGCGAAPSGLTAPLDTRYTYNPDSNRLYLHFLHWPFRFVHLPGLAGKVRYAQLLNDASEMQVRFPGKKKLGIPDDTLTLHLPVQKPPVEVPVIELFLT